MTDKARNHWLILFILALAQFMVVLDNSVVNVALPAVQKAFSMTPTNPQWIVTAYTLTFGGFLLLGGRAADLYGRRRVFLTGIALFGLMSLAAGLAQSGTQLIAFRALQGLAAALMSPAALSIVLVAYREGHERNTALAVWGAVASGGAAAGVLLGGILTEYLNWRWNLIINVPIVIGVLFAAMRLVPAHESEERHNDLDLPGAISITGAMLLLVYGLVKAPANGWTDGSTLAYFGISILLLAFFIFNELRVKRPLIPLGIFKFRNISGANLTILPMTAAMFATFYFCSLYLQLVLRYSPVKTGLSFLVVPLVIGVVATNVPRLVKKVGYKPPMVAGPLLVACALLLLSRIEVGGTYFTVLPGLTVLGLGMGMTFVSVTIAATSGVPGHLSGLASGVLNTSQQLGGALGLAILSGIAASKTSDSLKHLPADIGPKLAPAYAQVQGAKEAFLYGACFAAAASLLAFIIVKQRTGAPTDAETAPASMH